MFRPVNFLSCYHSLKKLQLLSGPSGPVLTLRNAARSFPFRSHLLGRVSISSSFVSLFIFYILSYLLSKMMGCFSGRLISSASGQKLFCEACSAFKCSFDEFIGEKVVSPSYSSAILAPPLCIHFHIILDNHFQLDYRTKFKWKHRNN